MKNNSSLPLRLNAEITYKCPLHCVFCYNPLNYANHDNELDTESWVRVFSEARKLGSVQLGLSGGEPMLRKDIETLVEESCKLGFFTNLITSGIGLTDEKIGNFKKYGLGQIQLSFQDSTKELNDFLSSTKTFELKSKVAKLIKKYKYPMVLNVVLHRLNIDHIEEILNMALEMQADHVELANTQYYAWAYLNRENLIPTKAQILNAEKKLEEFRIKVGNKMKLYFVLPDYYETRPKACMNGWGTTFLNIAADGVALPCHEARMLPNINLPNVKEHSIDWIWNESSLFNKYRGVDWMEEPCKSCNEKEKDFGGCRCQAFLITGNPDSTDPICDKSPNHHIITEDVEKAQNKIIDKNEVQKVIKFRTDKNSLEMSEKNN